MKYNDLLNTIKNVHVMTANDIYGVLDSIDAVRMNYMNLSDSEKNILTATQLLCEHQLKLRGNIEGVNYATVRV